MKKYYTQNGFTLLELMLVVGIVAIIAAYAIPSMQSTLQKNSVRSLQRELLNTFAYARDEAVTRNKLVSICPSVDGLACDTTNYDWNGGWLVFIDNGAGTNVGNGELDGDELLLQVQRYTGKSTLVMKNPDDSFNDLNFVSWTYRGFTNANTRALAVICADQDEPTFRRGLMVARSGRVLHSRDYQNNDGVHEAVFEDASGNADYEELTCS